MTQEPERTLVQLSKQGDLQAFNELFLSYEKLVYNMSARMLSDATAEDATQEAFISAFRNIRKFRGDNFRAWLLRIAANACHDQLRSPRRRREVSLDATMADSYFDVPSGLESPENYALRQELGHEIQRGLATLPDDQRLALVLIDLQGLSYEEAAASTGSSLGTVKSRLSRARARLRDHMLQRRELLPQEFRLSK